MKLLCVTVNFRTPELTLRLLESLTEALDGLDAAITVVENHSGDHSEATLRRGIGALRGGAPVRLLCSDRNLGFGGGNNLAIRAALAEPELPDVIHLINPDAVPEPDALHNMLAFLESHPRVGVAGSAVIDGTGALHSSAFRFPSPLGELEGRFRLGPVSRLLEPWRVPLTPGGVARPVDWVSGSSCALTREMLERIGLFDEGFFLYFEETDLCRRARAAGYEVWTVPESLVHHTGAVATGLNEHTSRRPPYWFASRRRYFRKHHGRWVAALADAAWLLGSLGFGAKRLLTREPQNEPPKLVSDFLRHSLGLLDGESH